MKKYLLPTLTFIAFFCLSGCGGDKPKQDVIIATPEKSKETHEVQKMSEYTLPTDVHWLGKDYKVIVSRKADKNLPIVQVDKDVEYYDNKVSVTVLREDGSEFFRRTFTKKDFAAYATEHIKQHGTLSGVNFIEASGDWLVFACSIGSPEKTSDEYILLSMKVSRMGEVKISSYNHVDTRSASQNKADVAEEG